MAKDLKIDIHHLTRVEGHGNIVLDVKNGEIKELRLDIVEAPRFFEAMLLGRPITEAQAITSRICGICACGHSTVSLQASEAALGVKVDEQTKMLRKIVMFGENLTSHILHFYFLIAPDLLGVPSVLPLAGSHPEVVLRALRMKKIANDLCEVFVGRHTHPITMRIGGFCYFPKEAAVKAMRDRLEKELLPDLWETVKLFSGLKFPEFTRKTEYLALSDSKEYAFIDGEITSSEGGKTKVADYLKKIKETVVPHSSAKFCHSEAKSGGNTSYMVGALARFNVNYKQLHPKARKAADELGMKFPDHNPYHNSLAQLVECLHMTYEAIRLMDELVKRKIKPVLPNIEVKTNVSGDRRGVGAVEVPRGTLYHEYGCDENGIINFANCIIPTGQNLANIEDDFKKLVPEILDQPKERIALLMEMLVRAYDPCISCSAHFLNVEFV